MILKILAFACSAFAMSTLLLAATDDSSLRLHTRSREANKDSEGQSKEMLKTVAWDPAKTASLSSICGTTIGAKVRQSESRSWLCQ